MRRTRRPHSALSRNAEPRGRAKAGTERQTNVGESRRAAPTRKRQPSAARPSARDTRPQRDQTRASYIDLFDFAPVTYMLLDAVGLILEINRAGCDVLDFSRAHIVGHPLLSFAVNSDRREVLEHLRRCRLQDGMVESEIRFSTRDGQPVTCRLYTRRAKSGRRDLFPTVIVDQTERLALDEARLAAERLKDQAERDREIALRANATKDRFLAMVSHELRTPLTPALFAAGRLAAWEVLSDDARKLAVTVKRNIELQARLIDDLLDVARINRNRVDLQLENIDLHDVVREASSTCQSLARHSGVSIAMHLAASAHHVNGDRVRLQQVFWNILNNAIKFTAAGGRIVVTSVNVGADVLRVTIRDDGAGMSPKVLEKLFTAFEHKKAHKSRSGLGLGLAISKGIVAAHHGQIWATSEGPGCGSAFGVELATVPLPAPHAGKTPGATAQPDRLPPLRVLIVEDDRDTVEMLSLFLSQEGCDVDVASTLADGLRKLDQQWDVVLSDLGLPDGSGLEVARSAGFCRSHPSG